MSFFRYKPTMKFYLFWAPILALATSLNTFAGPLSDKMTATSKIEPTDLCARMLAVMKDHETPTSTDGQTSIQWIKSQTTKTSSANRLKAFLERLDKSEIAEAALLLKSGALPGHEKLWRELIKKETNPDTNTGLASSLAFGWESYTDVNFWGSARTAAAWTLAEVQYPDAATLILPKIDKDPSISARAMYEVSLARLGDTSRKDIWIKQLHDTRKEAEAHTTFSKDLSLPLHSNQRFGIELTERSAAALALGFSKTPGDQSVNSALLETLKSLLSEPIAMGSNHSIRKFKIREDALNSDINPDEHLLHALIFALSERRVKEAYPILEAYWMSMGHYRGSDGEQPGAIEIEGASSKTGMRDSITAMKKWIKEKGEFDLPKQADQESEPYIHGPRIDLVISAMYAIDPTQTVKALITKLREANYYLSSNDYTKTSLLWRFMYTDHKIREVAENGFTASEWKEVQTQCPKVKYFTHMDFQSGRAGTNEKGEGILKD